MAKRPALTTIVACALTLLAPAVSEATSVTILFSNTGPEEGVTVPGVTDFSFVGSNWTGGSVRDTNFGLGIYQVVPSRELGVVTFDQPIDSVEFLFVAGTAFIGHGRATVFNASADVIASIEALDVFSIPVDPVDPIGAVSSFLFRLDPDEPIARIEFDGGEIALFTFTPVPEPTSGALVALGATLLAARRGRRRSQCS